MAFLRLARRSLSVVLLATCGALIVGDSASAEYTFVTKWGSSGTGDSQFQFPAGVATDLYSNVYVSDLGDGSDANDQIRKFTSGGEFLVRWGSEGVGDPRLFNPWGLAIDPGGFVYVADSAHNYVKKFSSTGAFIDKFGGPPVVAGEAGKFNGPAGMAVDSAGNVYATDFNAGTGTPNRIQKFKPSLSGYLFDTQWGVFGSGQRQFKNPHDVATDANGNVYVSDYQNHRIQKFDSEGFFLTEWGGMGSGDGQLAFPEGIATDSACNVYVADRANNRIQKFNSNGVFITKWGSSGSGDGRFLEPSDVAIDASGNVYVVDTGNDRIQKFVETGTPSGGSCGGNGNGNGGGGNGGGAVVIDVSNEFKLENTTVLLKSGKLKFVLNLPAPGNVEAIATVKAPPRPPALDPDQRKHEGHKSTAKKKKPIVVATGKAAATEPGPLTLTLAPNKLGNKFLGWRGTLQATVTITYTPTGGAAKSISRSVKLELARRKKT